MYKIMKIYYESSLFTECKFKAKMKEPFKFDLGVLNFKELKVNCEIAKKPSDFEVLARRYTSLLSGNCKRCYSKYDSGRVLKILQPT